MAFSDQDKQPLPMEFKTKEEEKETFEHWILRVRGRLSYLASIVSRPSRTEATLVLRGNKMQQEELTAHLDFLLEELSNIALEVKEHTIRAKEYYQEWISITTTEQVRAGWTTAKKTAQDFAVKLNCSERRIMERLDAMNATIEFRTTICQSMIKSMKP